MCPFAVAEGFGSLDEWRLKLRRRSFLLLHRLQEPEVFFQDMTNL
jgi:hypothetical protein